MATIFYHRENDFTGSTRALSAIIESYPATEKVIVVTIDKNKNGFLSNLSNVRLKTVYYPTINGKNIKALSYIISQLHFFVIAFTTGYKFNDFYINTIVPYPAAIAGWLLRKRIIYNVHEKFLEKSLSIKIVEFFFNKLHTEQIYVSNYVKSQYPTSKKKSSVQFNKLPKSFIDSIQVTSSCNRSQNRISMICSLTRAKGIESFVAVATQMPQYQFNLVISTSIQNIDNFFVNHNLPKNLKIFPVCSNIHEIYQQTDLLLNLSIPSLCIETFGYTILEAMAYGIPSIVPNVGGPTELVKNGLNGFCVDTENISEISLKISTILNSDNFVHFVQGSFDCFKVLNENSLDSIPLL